MTVRGLYTILRLPLCRLDHPKQTRVEQTLAVDDYRWLRHYSLSSFFFPLERREIDRLTQARSVAAERAFYLPDLLCKLFVLPGASSLLPSDDVALLPTYEARRDLDVAGEQPPRHQVIHCRARQTGRGEDFTAPEEAL